MPTFFNTAAPPAAEPAPPAAPPSTSAPENPSAGGNYLRNPATGALTRNPAYPVNSTEE